MSLSQWEMWICAPNGVRIAPIRAHQIGVTLTTNTVGAWNMVVPTKRIKPQWLVTDAVIEFWRKPFMASTKIVRTGFVRSIEYYDNDRNTEMLELGGPDSKEILDTRVIAYPAGEPESSKSGYADNLMKAFVRENIGSSAIAARTLSSISVDPDNSLGASVDKAGSYDNLLKVLQGLASSSAQNGVPLYFDLVPVSRGDGTISYLFTTSVYQPMSDRRQKVIFSKRHGNLSKARLRIDRTSEKTVVYAGGPGEGVDRLVREAIDTTRLEESIYGRREMFVNATNAADASELDSIGEENLYKNRPKMKFTGELLNTLRSRFGVDWDHGDRVTIDYQNMQFDAVVKTTPIRVQGNKETIRTRVEIEL